MKTKTYSLIILVLLLIMISTDVTGFAESLAALKLPQSLRLIEKEAFFRATSIEKVIVPDGTTEIRSRAFAESSLKELVLPDTLSFIAADAFKDCSAISVTVPKGCYAYERCVELGLIIKPHTNAADFTYTNLSSTECAIMGYSGTETELILPTMSPDGHVVKQIGKKAFENCSNIISITIPDGITSIEFSAFSGCSSLTSVVIPDSVTNIGAATFLECISLNSIIIPDSVISIGHSAFSNCKNMTFAIISSNLTRIESGVFFGCSKLTSFIIPDGVTSIGERAFYGCSSLTSVTIPDSVTSIGEKAFCACRSLTSLAIPDSVMSIGKEAFGSCSGLTAIIIPDSVTSIEEYAFNNCTSLISATMLASVTRINRAIFYRCNSLTSIIIPNSVTSIEEEAFMGCRSLSSIMIPASVTSIWKNAFDACPSLTIHGEVGSRAQLFAQENSIPFFAVGTAVLSAPVISIDDTLYNAIQLQWDDILGATGYDIFYSMDADEEFTYLSTTADSEYLHEDLTCNTAYYYKVLAYDDASESDFSNVAQATTEDQIIDVGFASNMYVQPVSTNAVEITWDYCENADGYKVDVSGFEAIEIIGRFNTSYVCDGLNQTDIYRISVVPFAYKNNGERVYGSGCGYEEFELPKELKLVVSIEDTSIEISESIQVSVQTTGGYGWISYSYKVYYNDTLLASRNCSENQYSFSPNMPGVYAVEVTVTDELAQSNSYRLDGISVSEHTTAAADFTYAALSDTTCEISGYIGSDTELILPMTAPDGKSIVSIGKNAFLDNVALTSIVICDNITEIKANAFEGCTSLVSVQLGINVSVIGNEVFDSCTSLTDINMHDNISVIGKYAFARCSSLRYFTVPNRISIVPEYMFWQCSNLQEIVLPNGVTEIGRYAFESCTSLTRVIIPDSLTAIGGSAFRNCTQLTDIQLPDRMSALGSYTFANCSSIVYLAIPQGVTKLLGSVFYNCNGMLEVHIPSSITSIGTSVFDRCTALQNVYFQGTKQQYIGLTVDKKNDVLNSAVIHFSDGSDTNRDPYVYNSLSSTTCEIVGSINPSGKLVIPNTSPDGKTVVSIGEKAFFDKRNIVSIVIPDTVTTIGESAFECCESLSNILLPSRLQTISKYMLSECYMLTSVDIPKTVRVIDVGAFSYCTSLNSIRVPKRLNYVENYAFEECNSLRHVYFEGTREFFNDIEIDVGNSPLQNSTLHECSDMLEDYVFAPLGSDNSLCEVMEYNGESTKISIPSVDRYGRKVVQIGVRAFYNSSSITTVDIPNSIISICDSAFFGCDGLTGIVIPQSVTTIGEEVFDGCTSLRSATIPSSLKVLGKNLFGDCRSLNDITIPEGVKTIDISAFNGCSSLRTISVPLSVRHINQNAFYGCSNLQTVNYAGTKARFGSIAIERGNECLTRAGFRYGDGTTELPESEYTSLQVSDYSMTSTVVLNDSFSLSGTISSNGSKLKKLQIYAYEQGNRNHYAKIYENTWSNGIALFDLSSIILETNYPYGTFTLEAGSYELMLYVQDADGKDFDPDTRPQKVVSVLRLPSESTLTSVTCNNLALDTGTVVLGEEAFVSGTLYGNGCNIRAVQISVFKHEDHRYGGMVARYEAINSNSFSFENVAIHTGTQCGNTMITEGLYDVVVYVSDEYGKGFDEYNLPTIALNVTAKTVMPFLEIYNTKTGQDLDGARIELPYSMSTSYTFSVLTNFDIMPWSIDERICRIEEYEFCYTSEGTLHKFVIHVSENPYVEERICELAIYENGKLGTDEPWTTLTVEQTGNPNVPVIRNAALNDDGVSYNRGNGLSFVVGNHNYNNGYELIVNLLSGISAEWTVYTDNTDIARAYRDANGLVYIHAKACGTTGLYISHVYAESFADISPRLAYKVCDVSIINPITHRALIFGTATGVLNADGIDAGITFTNSLQTQFGNNVYERGAIEISTSRQGNATKLMNMIDTFAKTGKSTDVTYVCCLSHGHSGGINLWNGSYVRNDESGEIKPDDDPIGYDVLFARLAKIPGKIVYITGACHSGSCIPIAKKYGDKFTILAAANDGKTSYVRPYDPMYTVAANVIFIDGLLYAAREGDANRDGVVTTGEAFDYAVNFSDRQIQQWRADSQSWLDLYIQSVEQDPISIVGNGSYVQYLIDYQRFMQEVVLMEPQFSGNRSIPLWGTVK